MGIREANAVVKGFHTLFSVGAAAALTDPELLERFVAGPREAAEAAFAALVERHGPMVLRVCRGQLRDLHAAEDAFQATFLVLAKKARTIRCRGSLASWLFGVARRVARQACRDRSRRQALEQRGATMATDATSAQEPPLLLPEIQEEVDRLPEKYRAVVVLCYLEGLTQEEAASQLRIPLGTAKVRLARAREKLRGRLVRRGLAPAVLTSALAAEARAALPAPLVDATIQAAAQVAAGQAAAVSVTVAALVSEVLKGMFQAKLRLAAACATASMGLLVATALFATNMPTQAQPAQARVEDEPKVHPPAEVKTTQTDLPPADIAKASEKPVRVPAERVKKSHFAVMAKYAAALAPMREVEVYPGVTGTLLDVQPEVGDRVNAGQTVATIDAPELATEVERNKALYRRAQARLQKVRAAADLEPRDQDKAKRELAQASIAEAEADLKVAETDLRAAEGRATLTRVVAPISGIVMERSATAGSYVHARGNGASNPILTIVQSEKMKLSVQVPEKDVARLEVGQPAAIRTNANPEHTLNGKLGRLAYSVDSGGNIEAEIYLDNPDGKLRPGQSGTVTILLEDHGEQLTLPVNAVGMTPEGAASCLRVVDGRAKRTKIKVGKVSAGDIEILEGLHEGDTVLFNSGPFPRVEDGQAVEPIDTSKARTRKGLSPAPAEKN